MEILIGLIIWFIIIGVLVYFNIRKPPFFTVQEQQAVIIERWGRFRKVFGAGAYFMLPFGIERKRVFKDGESLLDYVDLRERTVKVSPQNVITKDNIHLHVDGIAYYEITHPAKAVYAVADVIFAINKLLEVVLRDVIEDMEFEEILKRRHEMSIKLRDQTAQACDDWGITIRSVELETVTSLGMIDSERPLQQGKVQHIHTYFLSHSSENNSEADHVEAMLWRNKKTVLRDESGIKTDEETSETRNNMIKSANTVVVLWNGHYVNTEWCLEELEYACKQQAKTQNPSRIVLITLDETEVPDKFSDALRLSGQNRNQRKLAIHKLLKEEWSK